MKENKQPYSVEELYKYINKKQPEKVCEMIRADALEEMNNEEIKDAFRSLMKLRSQEVIDLLAKKSHYFPIEMLDIEIRNHNDKDFVSFVLEKYGKKFKYKEHGDRLFEVACKAECKPMLLFLLAKGLGESQYPRLVSGSEKLLEVLHEVKPKALHPDTVVTFFIEAAISDHPEDNIRFLMQDGFDITKENSSGLNACEALSQGIETYDYGKGKRAKTEKQKDRQGLKVLERIYKQYIEE